MELNQAVKQLDGLVLQGQFMQATEQFFHPKVVVHSSPTDVVMGKQGKLAATRHFLDTIATVNEITLHNQSVGDGVTMSEFTFDFTQHDGNHLAWHEVIRRIWRDGLVIDEKYYIGEKSPADQTYSRMKSEDTDAPVAPMILEGETIITRELNVDRIIPDDPDNPLESAIHLEDGRIVKDLGVAVDITHPFSTDLRIVLYAPSGSHAILYDREGGSTTNLQYYYDKRFMENLINEPIAGSWKLVIHDLTDHYEGKLNRWQLRILPHEPHV